MYNGYHRTLVGWLHTMLLSGNTYGLPTMDSIATGGVGGKVSVQGPLKLTFFCKKKYTCS